MSQIDKLLDVARKYIGTAEQPLGSNNVIFNTKYYGKAVSGSQYSWCANFVGYCCWEAGILGLTPFYKDGNDFRYNAQNSAYCPNWVTAAKSRKQWVTGGYAPGDFVLFGRLTATHIGIVERVSADGKTLTTIEGNTSDKVARKTYTLPAAVLGAFRPGYSTIDPDKTLVESLVRQGKVSSSDMWLRALAGSYKPTAQNVRDLLIKYLGAETDDYALISALAGTGRIANGSYWSDVLSGATQVSVVNLRTLLGKYDRQ
jgi:hypothetical protein